MKNWLRSLSFVVVFGTFLAIFFSSCRTTCERTRTYIQKTPVYASLTDIRNSFVVGEAKVLKEPGKIHVNGDYLFIVDWGTGFHIVDNRDIGNPVFLKFVQLMGCTDVVSRSGILYANQGPDIVSLNITDINNISLVNRDKDAMNMHLVKQDSFVIRYLKKEIVEVIEDADCGGNRWGGLNGSRSFDARVESSGGGGGSSSSSTGSMARFAIIDGYLYVVDNSNLRIYGLSNPEKPQKNSVLNIGAEVETIYGAKDHLFIGTTTGMSIYKTSFGSAEFVSAFSHARGCDPVVVEGDLAYVTLRGNGNCGEANDELSILDISNLSSPKVKHVYPMHQPYGLGIRNNLLAICDGNAGLRLFDASKISDLLNNEYANETGMKAFDVILQDGRAILSAEEGIFQYDVSDPSKPIRKSTLFAK